MFDCYREHLEMYIMMRESKKKQLSNSSDPMIDIQL